jgi:hypothetical protein
MSQFNLPTLTEDQVKSMSETFFKGFYANPEITLFHDVEEGIKAKKQIISFGQATGLIGYHRTGCAMTPDTNFAIPSQEKHWDPVYISDLEQMCYDDFMANFERYGLKVGVEKGDLTGTDLAAFLELQYANAIKEVNFRHSWFGDTGIAAATGNTLSSGQLKYFNQINGFWYQLFAIVAANSARLSASTILATRNAGTTVAAQKFTTADKTSALVTAALDQMWYDADMKLRGLALNELIYITTQTVSDQYEKERKATGSIPEAYQRVESGVRTLQCNGIDVVPFQFQDRIIQSYFRVTASGNTADVLPHRAILTTRKNLRLGLESIGSLGQIDAWYSKDLKKYNLEFGNSIDAKVVNDDDVQVCY